MKTLLSLLAVSTLMLCDSICGMRLSIKTYTDTEDSIKEKYNVDEVYKFINSGCTPETNIDECIDFYERFKGNIFLLFLRKEKVLEIRESYSVTRFRGSTDIKYTRYCYPKFSITEEQKFGLFSEFYELYVLFFKWNNGCTKREAQKNGFLKWSFPNGMLCKQNYESEVEAWRQFNMSYDNYKTGWFSPYFRDDPSLPYLPK